MNPQQAVDGVSKRWCAQCAQLQPFYESEGSLHCNACENYLGVSSPAASPEAAILTAEQVLAEMEAYCMSCGNPKLVQIMKDDYARSGTMAPAILRSLNLEPITMWRRK